MKVAFIDTSYPLNNRNDKLIESFIRKYPDCEIHAITWNREKLPINEMTYRVHSYEVKSKLGNYFDKLRKLFGFYKYVKAELKDFFALADIVISRAGANAICELLALKKPNILIPLSVGSRGDQILNASSFEEQGFSIVIKEESLDCFCLIDKIEELYQNKQRYIETMNTSGQINAIPKIMELINEAASR